ncbi:thiamine pyrophosphate protein central region [Methylocella silvestris BL2]|uniref:Thiamine pyrophosphate protein central region n=1 Tax=Methylocella silvestris (strain DSM 15510 / CIP 108128 / LMG 27833 / NCIMB 13906 / BL2) TaxID=395965 RepID=B8ESY5_METSB|nr:ubiquinone-dependent pyruvate dehydrogenase [Methylocella silvestris]ACK51123.1 thiamine pyrophosphate protein central region [Methylocella silvestris BL2]
MSKKVADVLVETLVSAGVKNCYGIVGDTMNQIAHSIDRSSIDFVHMRHEEAGAFAAAAEAQLTGGLAACAGTCGPGSLHFINGLYEANRNRAPVVLIATQIVRRDLGFDSIQEVDFKDVFRGCSVYCDMILTPEHARRKTVAACQAALTKQGVAVLVVPADVANAAAPDEPPYAIHTRRPVVRPSDADLEAIAAILNSSEAITIYAGSGCENAHDEVVATAAKLKAPMAHTSRGKDFLEYNNPYNVGMTGIIGGAPGYHAVLDCDVLLLLGADFAWGQFYPDNARIIQIDINPTHLGRRHPVEIGLVGSIAATLEALLPRIRQHPDNAFLKACLHRYDKEKATDKAERPEHGDAAISGVHLTKVINKYAAEDALFASDDGTPTVWMTRHIDTAGKRRTFASLLHGTMAGGMPSALGLQKCQPGRQVISLSGDGGLAMLFGDLLTTVQENLPIKIAVYDNGKLGFVDIEQKAAGLVPVFTDLKNPDFGAVATAMGLWGASISKVGELEEAVQEWLAQKGPALLHVKVKPMELVMPPTPFVQPDAIIGMAVYSAKAVLQGKGHDVWEMVIDNIP